MLTGEVMDQNFWLKRWKDAETGFHRGKPHPMLVKHWPRLALAKGCPVFVPLCGKSTDMIWLAERGHPVIGAELSAIAIDGFFDGLNLTASSEHTKKMEVKSAGDYRIFQGDILALTPQDVGDIGAIYDRAALVALPPEMQGDYVDVLTRLLAPGGQVFLVNLTYDQMEMNGPPFSISAATVAQLFSNAFDIECREKNDNALVESQNLKERGLTSLTESLDIMTRRA